MADADYPISLKSVQRIMTLKPARLNAWPKPEPQQYEALFAVNIVDTDWENLTCEVRRLECLAVRQADLTDADFDMAMQKGIPIASSGLDLRLDTKKASLVIIRLAEKGATFADRADPDARDVRNVIMKDATQGDMIYQPSWLKGATDKKAISVILRAGDPTAPDAAYALRIRTEAGSMIGYHDIDPKIENDGHSLIGDPPE
jgi:hypothetical protein